MIVLCVASTLWCGAIGAGAVGAAPKPTFQLSSTTLVPGQILVLSGTGWPQYESVVATLCGADAVSGTADCVVTRTTTMVATHHGLLYSRIPVVVPPQPCPCVMLVTSVNTGFNEKVPVRIQGAPTAPVRRLVPNLADTVVISNLEITGSPTVGSVFGAPASRTISFTLRNPGRTVATPVLVGRWGKGPDPSKVITMPTMRPLAAGGTRTVNVPFDLGALSMGSYLVKVQVQVVGYGREPTAWSTTTQWPIALFILIATVVAFVVAVGLRRRRRRREEVAQAARRAEEPTGEVPVVSAVSAPAAEVVETT